MKNSFPVSDKYQSFRFRLLFNQGFLFYAEYNIRLFFKLLFSKKDILWANDLDTLLPNFLISKICSVKLIYDSHEYFTEVPELINRRRVRSIWLFIENNIFQKLKNVITVNEKIAEIYTEKYKVPVTVIKNVPSLDNSIKTPFEFVKDDERIILYQGSLNKGRGLELMIDAMPLLKNVLLIIIGDGYQLEKLKNQVTHAALQDKVIFLGKKLPEELAGLTKNADVGISLEEDLGLNYRYALPNKIFDYIQAGVPVVASDLPLLDQLFQEFKVGEVLRKRDPESLAGLIEKVISNKDSYQEALKEARSFYNWNNEKKVLINFIKKIE